MELHFIFMILNTITGTHYLIDALTTWAFAVLCWWLPIYNLCHMSNTCPLQKQKDPLRNTAYTQFREARIKGESIPIGQGHRLQGKSVTRLLVKELKRVICEKATIFHTSAPIVYRPPATGNESCMSRRKDTSRNFACKSFNTELRNVKHVFLQFFPFH